jgi:tryptophan 2,3-dioxygenase
MSDAHSAAAHCEVDAIGSLGVEFLKRSLFKSVFPDLWAIRHDL